jgi:hypothetical protein
MFFALEHSQANASETLKASLNIHFVDLLRVDWREFAV